MSSKLRILPVISSRKRIFGVISPLVSIVFCSGVGGPLLRYNLCDCVMALASQSILISSDKVCGYMVCWVKAIFP